MEGRSSGAVNPRDRIVAVAIAGPAPARGQKRSRGAQAAHARFWAIATASDTSILGETPRALSQKARVPTGGNRRSAPARPPTRPFRWTRASVADGVNRRSDRQHRSALTLPCGALRSAAPAPADRSSVAIAIAQSAASPRVEAIVRDIACFRVGTTLPVVRSRWRDERSWTRAGAPRLPGVIPLFPRGSTLVSEEVGFCFSWARALAAAAGLTSELAPATACWVRSAGKCLFPRPRESGPIAWATSGLPTAGDALSLETGEEQVARRTAARPAFAVTRARAVGGETKREPLR